MNLFPRAGRCITFAAASCRDAGGVYWTAPYCTRPGGGQAFAPSLGLEPMPLVPLTILLAVIGMLVWAVPDAVGDDTSAKLLWATVAFVPPFAATSFMLDDF